jgi:hypothetical protein
MKDLLDFIEVEDERKRLQEKFEPLQKAHARLYDKENEINENLGYKEKNFIIKKLIENQTEEERDAVKKYWKDLDTMFNNNAYYNLQKNVFDPEHDEFRIFTFEKEGDKIRFAVSCKKNEGFVMGMTLLDTYWTSWFNISELYGD